MQKFFLTLLALALAFAITPAAMADTFEITLNGVNGNQMSFNGTFVATEIGNTGVYSISSMTGTFSDTNNGLSISGAASLITTSSGTSYNGPAVNGFSGAGFTSPDQTEIYDNLFKYPASPDYLDGFGVLFSVPNGSGGYYEVSIAQSYNPNDSTYYGAWVSNLGSFDSWVDYDGDYNYGAPLDITINQDNLNVEVSPEPSSLLLLGTGLLGLAFVAFRKAKSSGLILHP